MDSALARLPPRSVAIVQGIGRPLNWSILIGGVVTVVVVIVLVALGALELLGWVIAPFVMAAVAALVGVTVAILVLPRTIRRAFEAYSWQGHAEVERFKERTGSPVPTKVEAMEQWLAANPATPAMALPSGTEVGQSGAVMLAICEARIRLVERDPNWTAPLEAVRPRLGSVPWRVTIADTWRQIFVLFGVVGLITAMVVPLLRATL